MVKLGDEMFVCCLWFTQYAVIMYTGFLFPSLRAVYKYILFLCLHYFCGNQHLGLLSFVPPVQGDTNYHDKLMTNMIALIAIFHSLISDTVGSYYISNIVCWFLLWIVRLQLLGRFIMRCLVYDFETQSDLNYWEASSYVIHIWM